MKEWYLLSYDQVMVLGWFWILFLVVSEMYLHDGEYKTVFEVVWPALSYVQTAALCEVMITYWKEESPFTKKGSKNRLLILYWVGQILL